MDAAEELLNEYQDRLIFEIDAIYSSIALNLLHHGIIPVID